MTISVTHPFFLFQQQVLLPVMTTTDDERCSAIPVPGSNSSIDRRRRIGFRAVVRVEWPDVVDSLGGAREMAVILIHKVNGYAAVSTLQVCKNQTVRACQSCNVKSGKVR